MDQRQYDERQEEGRDVAAVGTSGISAVSWAAILAGAVATAAVSLLLFALATGLDLATQSPDRSAPLASLAASAAIALLVIQWVSSGLGGYITGRLRTRWVGTHTHEVFFRDTVHGFLTWCVATLFIASGLVAAGTAAAAHGSRTNVSLRAPAFVADSIGTRATDAGAVQGGPASELLLRLTPAGSPQVGISDRAAAAARVPGRTLLPETPDSGEGPADAVSDTLYVARLVPVPGNWGVRATQDLRQRLDAPVPMPGGDAERKDAAAVSIFTALSMLVGAFIASVSAAIGGRLRDRHP